MELTTTQQQAVTPMELLAKAQAAGASIEQMQQLMDLQDRFEAKEARKAFNRAIAAFRAEGIKIVKNKRVEFTTNRGITKYDHAELGDVVEKIVPALSRHGLSHNWEMNQGEKGQIKVTCRLSHIDGHSETAWLQADPDDSGGKNKIQQVASTVTYLQRYTLLAVTGLATHDTDDDGRSSASNKDMFVNDEQLANIDALIVETGADVTAFCTYMKADSLQSINAKDYETAIHALEKKRRAK